jgi:RES domain-containing protein
MPRAWRLVKARHAAGAFDGEGARLHGGRWNSPGTRVVYVSSSRSLAALELLVHLEIAEALEHYAVIEVRIPAQSITRLDPRRLPLDWRSDPPPAALRALGDAWVRAARSVALEVPSVVVPDETNYLLNPAHPSFRRIAIGKPQPFRYDARLTRRRS